MGESEIASQRAIRALNVHGNPRERLTFPFPVALSRSRAAAGFNSTKIITEHKLYNL